MKWFRAGMDKVKELSSTEPVPCPRGWGDIKFNYTVDGWSLNLSRQCPIGGVEYCSACSYPYNPNKIETMKENLQYLEQLRQDNMLTEREYNVRRFMIVCMLNDKSLNPGFGYRVTAWILGPLGIVSTAAGAWLGFNLHPGYYGISGIGAAMICLSLSFFAIARIKKKYLKKLLAGKIV